MGVKHFPALFKAMVITDFSADGIFFMPNVQLFQVFSVPWPKSNQTLDLRKIKQECYCPIILHRNDMDDTFSDETPPELSSCLFWEGWCSLQGVVNEARY